MTTAFVAILMGSDSDLPVMEASFEILKKFDIPFEVKVTSAHRTPAATHSYVTDADARGCAAFICAAGMAAHLAGAVSATTLKPVIGVPINGSLDGFFAHCGRVARHFQSGQVRHFDFGVNLEHRVKGQLTFGCAFFFRDARLTCNAHFGFIGGQGKCLAHFVIHDFVLH